MLSRKKANFHFMVLVCQQNGKIVCEKEFIDVFEPELILDLEKTKRPIEDWFNDSLEEQLFLYPRSILPENIEICEDPVFVECIGHMHITCNLSGDEYYEDANIDIHEWSVDLCD